VSIIPFLYNQAFEPETIVAMSDAYQNACQTLGLADRNDPLNELVAKRVIELARMGVHTSAALYTRTLQEFKAHAA
jgi:hypothetical protein